MFAGIDRSTLRPALVNLVDNAIKYTPHKGHIRVAVRLAVTGEAVVEVIDDGPGRWEGRDWVWPSPAGQ